MFKHCNTIAELNATRCKIVTQPDIDLVAVNNSYNERRTEILASRVSWLQLKTVNVKPREVRQYCNIPIVGTSDKPGQIILTPKGFLY